MKQAEGGTHCVVCVCVCVCFFQGLLDNSEVVKEKMVMWYEEGVKRNHLLKDKGI